MLYTVECSYADPASEKDWNTFYSLEKLPALISVTGFITSQRFRALGTGCPAYLAIHTIADARVLNGEEYRLKGGGNFSHWQASVTDWQRSLYECEGLAPAVSDGQVLLLSTQPIDFIRKETGCPATVMNATGQADVQQRRFACVLDRDAAVRLSQSVPDARLYEPVTPQLHKAVAEGEMRKQLTLKSRQIGDFLVTALSDGVMSASLALLSDIKTADAENIQLSTGITEPGDIHINCYLIRGRGRTILVDAGTGGSNNAGGMLKSSLRAAGVSPDDIDTVLLTHAHPDHIGGLLDDKGLPVYKNAELHLHPLEAGYWWNEEEKERASERVQRNFILARRTLEAYAHNLHFLSHEEIVEGISPVWLPGHTPGHTGFRIDSGDSRLIIWGDIVHFPHIQSAHPDVSITFDTNPVQARETRKALLGHVFREKTLVAGMHLGPDGFARIGRSGNGYHIAIAANETDAVASL